MKRITLAHGSGGKVMRKLIEDIFFRYLGNEVLKQADDSACISTQTKNIAFTTDSFVVKPLFFPGGDIGKLSICGTVNDLAVCGANPRYINCSFIIEEGLTEPDLIRIVKSMFRWAEKSEVKIVAGDTKVVEKGAADSLFINTSGIGELKSNLKLGMGKINIGDKVVITGTIGDHGIAILSKRKGLEFESPILSDCAPLNKMLMSILDVVGGVRFMRDPTRGGVATALNEIVNGRDFGILIDEEKIPALEAVKAACELLGLDPLYIANEGKALLIIDESCEKEILKLLHRNEYGREAQIIGEVTKDFAGKVCLKTRYGAVRVLDMLSTESMPRIC